MIAVLHASIIMLAIAHIATLPLLALDLRRTRPMSSSAAVVLGGGAMAAGAGVASLYVPGWPAALAGTLCGALFVGYLSVRRHELRPAGVAAWSSFVLMTLAASAVGRLLRGHDAGEHPDPDARLGRPWARRRVRSFGVGADQGGVGAADPHAVALLPRP